MKKYTVIFFTGFLLVFAIVGCKEEVSRVEPIRPIKAIQIGTMEEFIGRSFPGKARAFKEVNLGFEVAGILAERAVKKGDKVQKGQLLARLDPRDFQNALNAVLAELDRADYGGRADPVRDIFQGALSGKWNLKREGDNGILPMNSSLRTEWRENRV